MATTAIEPLWAEKTRAEAKKSLRVIVPLWPDFDFNMALEIVLAALIDLSNDSVAYGELIRALRAIPTADEITLERVEVGIWAQRKLATRLSTKKRLWNVLSPIAIELSSPRKSLLLQAGGMKCLVCTGEKVVAWFRREMEAKRASDPLFAFHLHQAPAWSEPRAFLSIQVRAAEAHEAMAMASNLIDVVRGAIEFAVSALGWTFSSGVVPLERLPIGSFSLVIAKSEKARYFQRIVPASSSMDFQSPRVPLLLRPTHLSTVHDIFRAVRNARVIGKDGSIGGLVIKCLSLYANAVEQPFENARFLAWWQFAECITLVTNHHGKTKLICERLSWICQYSGLPAFVTEIELKALANMRNDYVHRNQSRQISQLECNRLKWLCDQAFLWLLVKGRVLPTQHDLEGVYVSHKASDNARNLLTNLYMAGYPRP